MLKRRHMKPIWQRNLERRAARLAKPRKVRTRRNHDREQVLHLSRKGLAKFFGKLMDRSLRQGNDDAALMYLKAMERTCRNKVRV